MSSLESQEKMKEEAKAIRARLDTLIKETDVKSRIVRTTCVYAGMITESLLDFEEPDVVMEQAFHRIADLLRTDPATGDDDKGLMPLSYDIDRDTEVGRHIARNVAEKLPKGIDDLHEIAIALVINDFPDWEQKGYPRDELLRLLVEAVIASLTFEMATQDFCDMVIEDFIADGNSAGRAILALSAVAGFYFAKAGADVVLPSDSDREFTNVMVRESLRHGTPGPKDWDTLAPANDADTAGALSDLENMKPEMEEFFGLIGLENPLGQAVSVAKAVGRMVAVIAVEDVGQIHPSIAKSLAKTGMILGSRHYADQAKT